MLNETSQIKKAAQLLKVLGNPHRLQIIVLLLNGEKNVTQINQSVRVSQPALSQHLSRLRREGVLASRRDQRQIYYFINNTQISRLLDVAADIGQLPTASAKKLQRGA